MDWAYFGYDLYIAWPPKIRYPYPRNAPALLSRIPDQDNLPPPNTINR